MFDFAITTTTAIPAEASKRETGNKLPFGDLYAKLLAATVAGATKTPREIGSVFIPQKFWEDRVKELGNADTKVDATYQKEKLRNAFRTWQKEAEKATDAPGRVALSATYQAMYRKGGTDEFPAAGVSVWIDVKPAYLEALKADAKAAEEAAAKAAETAAKVAAGEAAKPSGKKAA